MRRQTNRSFWLRSQCTGLCRVLTVVHLSSGRYRWAVSSVMTRQNQIPTEDGSRVTLALIPLWDMCNHTNGLVMTPSALCLIRGAGVNKLSRRHSTDRSGPCTATLHREQAEPSRDTPPASHKEKLVFFSFCICLILKTRNLNLTPLSKTTVNCIYLLSHNSSLNIHFLMLLNHRLNQSFFFFLLSLKY